MSGQQNERRMRGPKGDQGAQGDQGTPGMSPAIRYSIVFLFVLSFLLAGGSYYLSVSSRASVVQLCQAGNESRAQQVTLWTHLISVSQPPPRETPQQRIQRAASIRSFLTYVRKVFAPRNCAGRFNG